LLEQRGKGSATYYIPTDRFISTLPEAKSHAGDREPAPKAIQLGTGTIPDSAGTIPNSGPGIPDSAQPIPISSFRTPDLVRCGKLLKLGKSGFCIFEMPESSAVKMIPELR
jgi:hypothetical protein